MLWKTKAVDKKEQWKHLCETQFTFPGKIHTPTGNSEGEGSKKAKIFEGQYKGKLEFPEGFGGGESNQKLQVGGESMDGFWNNCITFNV